MSRKGLISIIIFVVIIIVALLIYRYSQKSIFDESKAVDIGISNTIDYLDDCLNVQDVPMEERSELMRGCPSTIEEDNLSKLKTIENLKGISVNEKPSNCNIIYSFNYQKVIVKLVYNSISLYQCDSSQYIEISQTPPPTSKIYQVQLNEDILNQLK